MMINTLIIAGLIFALLCLAAWYGERQARAEFKARLMQSLKRAIHSAHELGKASYDASVKAVEFKEAIEEMNE